MTDTTTGKDLFNCLMSSLKRASLYLNKLVSITTDGAPSLRGKHVGLVNLRKLEIQKKISYTQFNCITLHYPSGKPL